MRHVVVSTNNQSIEKALVEGGNKATNSITKAWANQSRYYLFTFHRRKLKIRGEKIIFGHHSRRPLVAVVKTEIAPISVFECVILYSKDPGLHDDGQDVTTAVLFLRTSAVSIFHSYVRLVYYP
mmetsp:Transcript_7663/g.18461  ORF Transcript_7663/g.18461 Transcript_7663/m.18461 type:complete len:124 (-) Transcript_7663:3272-3643(-)